MLGARGRICVIDSKSNHEKPGFGLLCCYGKLTIFNKDLKLPTCPFRNYSGRVSVGVNDKKLVKLRTTAY